MPDQDLRLVPAAAGALDVIGAPLPIRIERAGSDIMRVSIGGDTTNAPSYLEARPPADPGAEVSGDGLRTDILGIGFDAASGHLLFGDAAGKARLRLELTT